MPGLLSELIIFGRNLMDGSISSTVLLIILIELVLLIVDLLALLIVILVKHAIAARQDRDLYITTPVEIKLSKIILDVSNVRRRFIIGDKFTYDGLIVNAVYSDGTETNVTNFTVYAPSIKVSGDAIVKVQYEDAEAEYSVFVEEKPVEHVQQRNLLFIEADLAGVKTEFNVNEQFSCDGLVLLGHYSAEPFSERLDNFTVEEPDMSAIGSQDVLVSYEGLTCTYSIDIKENRKLLNISLDLSSVKTIFDVNEQFSCDGLTVIANYSAEPFSEQLENFTVEEPDMSVIGSQDVVVSYEGFTCSYQIIINEVRTLLGISLDLTKVKTQFTVDEQFNYEEIIVTANYSAEPFSEQVYDFSVEAPDMSDLGEKEVKVNYMGAEACYSIEVLPDEQTGYEDYNTYLRYDRSFTARLIQSNDDVKKWYNEIKNALLSYKKVKDRMSWKKETYRCGREKVAIIGFRGKSMCLFLALNPSDYEESKYKVEDASSNTSYSETPCMYRIKNDRRAKYALQLIDAMMEQRGIARTDRISQDYYLPYEGMVELIEKGLIKRNVIVGTQESPYLGEAAASIDASSAMTEDATAIRALIDMEESSEAGVLRYDRSFTARLIQSNDDVKKWYNEIKNALLSYKKVKDRMSWKKETYRCGREKVAIIGFRGKSMCLFLALNPSDYEESKYKVEDASSNTSYSETPCMYRIKNDKRAKYALQLIDAMMEQRGIARTDRISQDYYLPYEGILELINKGLIRRDIKTNEDEAVFHNDVNSVSDDVQTDNDTSEKEVKEVVEETTLKEEPQSVEPEPAVEEVELDWSFKARLSVSNQELKERYSVLKNEILSYDGTESETNWDSETFIACGKALAKFAFSEDKFCVYLALDPRVYDGVGYKTEDVSNINGHESTPLRYVIDSDRDALLTCDLIADLMHKYNLIKYPRLEVNYFEPRREKEELIELGFIKTITKNK